MWRVAEFGVARLVVCLVAAAPGCARDKDEQDVVREAPYLAALAGRGRP